MFTIEKARSMKHPLKSHQFEFYIPNPPTFLSRESLAASLMSVPLAASILTYPLRVRQAMIPGITIEGFQTNWGPFRFGHAAKKRFGENEVFLRFEEGLDDLALPIVSIMYLWSNMIINETTDEGVPEESLFSDMYLRTLTDTGKTLYSIHFYYAYPSRVVDTVLDYSSPDLVNIDIMFAYDYWRFEVWPI